MQLTHELHRATVPPQTNVEKCISRFENAADLRMSSYVVDEINAYSAIRDIALAEAEENTDSVNVERVRIANDFVETCLKPARSPYQAQHLPEADAVREHQRCQVVKARIAQLHAKIAAASCDHVRAA
ncbi:MAG TPA: hypothetical protein VGI42_00505 [Chthoniobacterales bacterium]|jgi:hypothetical protein